jgi:DNA-binding FadR family transcriptional regulator
MNEMLFYALKESRGLTPSLATQVAREIGRRIVARGYEPGDLIEDEAGLAEKYQVSRSVIRDAVKILVGKGLLEVRRGIGTRVRARGSWGLLDDDVMAWHHAAPVSVEFLLQLTDMRSIIEPKAARWAAGRATSEERGAIAAAQLRMERAPGDVEDFIVADAVYHRTILRAAHNEILRAMEGVIFSSLIGSIRLTNATEDRNKLAIPLHRAVTDAIMARDGDAAETAMSVMLNDTRIELQKA